jgi:hypothetical protein
MTYYLELTIEVGDGKLFLVEGTGSYYVTPIESLDEIPGIVGNYIKENIEARKENLNA